MNRTDQKITLCKIKFNLRTCKKLSKEEIDLLFLFCPSVWNKVKAEKLCQYMDGWRQNTGLRLHHMQNISALFLWKLVQSDENSKIQNETNENSKIQNETKLKKTTVGIGLLKTEYRT